MSRCHFCWLVKSQLIDYFGRGGHIVFREIVFGSFMIIRLSLSCIHWLEFVYRMNAVTSFSCDLIFNVHYDIITSKMTLKMT